MHHALKIFILIFKTKINVSSFFGSITTLSPWSNIPIVFLDKSRLRFWFTTFKDNYLCLLQLPEIDVLTAFLLKYSRHTSRVLNGKSTAGKHDSKEISLCDIFKIHNWKVHYFKNRKDCMSAVTWKAIFISPLIETSFLYHFFGANQRKVDVKILLWTQYAIK